MAEKITLEHLENSGEYDVVEDVPVFNEHDEFDKDGNLWRRFAKSELTKLADVNNDRAEAGNISPFGPGHTIPGAPELKQPPVFGYVARYNVGEFGPDGKERLGLKSKLYVKRHYFDRESGEKKPLGKERLLDQYPFRSVELWKDNVIHWVAFTSKRPELDLCTVAYTAESRDEPQQVPSVLMYSQPGGDGEPCAVFREGALLYAMGDHMPFDPNQMPSPNDPTQQPDAKAPDQAEYARWLPVLKQFMAENYPQLARIHQEACTRYEGAGAGDAPPAAPNQPGAGNAGPGNSFIPDDKKKRNPAMPETYQAKDLPQLYTKLAGEMTTMREQLKSLSERNKKLEEEADAARYAKREAECNRLLDAVEGEGFIFNRERELKTLIPLDDAGRVTHLDDVRRYSKQGGPGAVPVGGFIQTGPAKRKSAMTQDEMYALLAESEKSGKSFAELAAARN